MLEPYFSFGVIEAGCDEAGRGCLAGPVFASAVILPSDYRHPVLNDSKQLSPGQRRVLRHEIEKNAVAWAVSEASPEEIDEMNILNASFLAMHRAIGKLSVVPQHLIIDGNRFRKYPGIPHTCIIKGDSSYYSIAAASVLAKTRRDEFMEILHMEYPAYNWRSNKGYPTKEHRQALLKNGPTRYHRMSFMLIDAQLKLYF